MLTLDQVRKQSGDYDLGRIQTLRVQHMDLQSLSVLIACKGLTTLDISQNAIMDISPLSRLTSLQVLVANDNKIRSLLPLQKLEQLRDLRASGNAFSSWATAVEQCCELKHLERLDLIPLKEEMPCASCLWYVNPCAAYQPLPAELSALESTLLGSLTQLVTLNGMQYRYPYCQQCTKLKCAGKRMQPGFYQAYNDLQAGTFTFV